MESVRGFFRSSILVLIVSNITNFFSFLIQAFLGRSLEPVDYGTYNATLSMGMVIGSLVNVIPVVMAKSVAEHSHQQWIGLFIKTMRKYLLVCCTTLGIGFSIVCGYLYQQLHYSSPTPLILYGAILFLSFPIAFYVGTLNGYLKYVPANMCLSLQASMRLLFSVVFVFFIPLGTNGALLAIVFADLFALIALFTLYKKAVYTSDVSHISMTEGVVKKAIQFSLPVTINWALLSALMYLDVFFVKFYVGGDIAGFYSGVSVLGRIAYFLPAMCIAVLLPNLAKKNPNSLKIVALSTCLTALASFSFAGFIGFFGEWPLKIMYGSPFLVVLDEFIRITFAMAFIAVIVTMTNTLMTRGNYLFLLVHSIILAGAYLGLRWENHTDAMSIVNWVLNASVLMFVCDLGFLLYEFWGEFTEKVLENPEEVRHA